MVRLPYAIPLLVAVAACRPDLNDRTSLIAEPRVLAMRSDPAEAKPGIEVSYSVLVATPDEASVSLEWAYCNARKPLAELGPVSPACVERTGDHLLPFGDGPSATATLPKQACRTFGPEVPEAKPGEPPGRPVDPDSTGGFHQPVRVLLDGVHHAMGGTRISCGLAGVTPAQLSEYQSRYMVNRNPRLDAVTVAGVNEPEVVGVGEHLVLRASWPTCDAANCEGAEPYVVFDPVERRLVEKRESMRIAWFATAGEFDADHTGRGGDDRETFSDNGWTAPATPGAVRLWVVARDNRGGVGWLERVLDVK